MTALGPQATQEEMAATGYYSDETDPPPVGCATPDNETPAVLPAKRRTSWTAAELMLTVFAATRWAVRGLISEGVNLLVGAPKLGKSWLALCIAVAIASGGKALGRIAVEGGDVLYLALEDTGRRLQSRLAAVLGDEPAPERLHLAVECAPLPDGGAARIADWLHQHPDARLVIVDVFARIRGTSNGNEGRYESDYRAMSVLKDLADEYGVPFLVVHHTRKAESTDFLDAVSGTQGLAGAADAVLVLARSRGSASAVLKVTGRDIEEAEHALDFDPATGTWQLLDGPASDYELSDTRRRILHLLRDGEPMTPKDIGIALSIPHETAKKAVRRMADDGQLDTDGRGTYFTPLSPVPPVPLSPAEGHGDAGDTSERGTA